MPEMEQTFEQAMEELNAIVDKLSAGNTPLDEMMRLYARGSALSKHCLTLLDSYEAKLDILDTEVQAP